MDRNVTLQQHRQGRTLGYNHNLLSMFKNRILRGEKRKFGLEEKDMERVGKEIRKRKKHQQQQKDACANGPGGLFTGKTAQSAEAASKRKQQRKQAKLDKKRLKELRKNFHKSRDTFNVDFRRS